MLASIASSHSRLLKRKTETENVTTLKPLNPRASQALTHTRTRTCVCNACVYMDRYREICFIDIYRRPPWPKESMDRTQYSLGKSHFLARLLAVLSGSAKPSWTRFLSMEALVRCQLWPGQIARRIAALCYFLPAGIKTTVGRSRLESANHVAPRFGDRNR